MSADSLKNCKVKLQDLLFGAIYELQLSKKLYEFVVPGFAQRYEEQMLKLKPIEKDPFIAFALRHNKTILLFDYPRRIRETLFITAHSRVDYAIVTALEFIPKAGSDTRRKRGESEILHSLREIANRISRFPLGDKDANLLRLLGAVRNLCVHSRAANDGRHPLSNEEIRAIEDAFNCSLSAEELYPEFFHFDENFLLGCLDFYLNCLASIRNACIEAGICDRSSVR